MDRKCTRSRQSFTCKCGIPKNPQPGYRDAMCDLLQVATLEPEQIIKSKVKYGVNLPQLLIDKICRKATHRFDGEKCITSEFTPIAFVMHHDGKNISVFGRAKAGGDKYKWVEVKIPTSKGNVYITFHLHEERTDDALVVVSAPLDLR